MLYFINGPVRLEMYNDFLLHRSPLMLARNFPSYSLSTLIDFIEDVRFYEQSLTFDEIQRKLLSNCKWSAQEDEVLLRLIDGYSMSFNDASLTLCRTAKACRHRYNRLIRNCGVNHE